MLFLYYRQIFERLAAFLIVLSATHAQELNSISEVLSLQVEQAAEALPVDLEAQVLRVDELRKACFLFDGELGIYARGSFSGGAPKQGDIVRVVGVTNPGGFNNSILPANIEVVGRKSLPPAMPYDSSMLHDPKVDCAWLAISGRLVSLNVSESHYLIIAELVQNNDRLNVYVEYTPENEAYLNDLLYDWVELNAVAATVFNTSRQATGRIFYANTASDFIRTNYAESRSLSGQTLPIHELMQPSMDYSRVVNTTGFVSHVRDRSFYLRGDSASIRVETIETGALARGDKVYVEGYVVPQPVSPAFSARHFEVLGRGVAPASRVVDLNVAELTADLNFDLVTIDASLVDVGFSFGPPLEGGVRERRLVLVCRAGERLFEAQLPGGVELDGTLEVGSKLRLTGICHLIHDAGTQWMLAVDSLWLEIRDADDILVLEAAPWWNSSRMLSAIIVILALAVLFAIWSFVLRRTVDRQTKIISEKVQQESVLTERQRMARELHDNLDQGLTGAAIQLQATRKYCDNTGAKLRETLNDLLETSSAINAGLREELIAYLNALEMSGEKTRNGLESVQMMLTHCAEESRSSILDLRGGLLERMDLPSAMREALLPLADEASVACDIKIDGEPRRLKHKAERHLLLVAREATVNSLRHASPNQLRVRLNYTNDALTLSIEDDGKGFDPRGWDKKGHFGLRGMQERVNRLNGKLIVDSLPGGGTRVFIDLNKLAEWELAENE
ncbi:MAG: histidine kinase [Lentimonas sp.]